jgi:diketogulonate reductase-like aldo/keto reductase
MKLDINSKLKMNNGKEIPQLGFGTWQIIGKAAEDSVSVALKVGYRHIDTARIYGNELEVGNAIKKAIKSGIKRADIFVTTKLWNDDHNNPEKAFNESLKKLGLEYIDLYIIHWPVPEKRIESWKVLEKLLKTGRVKSIGVSNFTVKHLQELMKNSKIVPAVNQVEFSPWLYQ